MAKRLSSVVVGLVLAVIGQTGVHGDTPATTIGTRVRVPVGLGREALIGAIHDALRRLESPDCQRVLDEFRDRAGRTIRENIESLGKGIDQYVREVWWVDASDASMCHGTNVAAFTSPNSRVIRVCTSRWGHLRFGLQGPHGAVVVIHEVLHSLGLGEGGPDPTAAEISYRVAARCKS